MTMLPKILAVAVFAGALIQPAIAQTGSQAVTVEFRYHEWQSPEQNYERLHRSIDNACLTPGVRLMITRISEAACVAGMVDAAIERLDRPSLAAVHLEQTGRSGADGRELASMGK